MKIVIHYYCVNNYNNFQSEVVMNKILTLFEYQQQFSTEEDCFEYLVKLRWPDGFVCPICGGTTYYMIYQHKRFQCKQCRHQTSVTAGTVFHKLRQPLRILFLAVYLIATSKKGLSAMELRRKVGINGYKTAWLLMQKIRKAMASSGKFPLEHMGEVDETYIGGHREGPRGRGADDKTLVAIAVETNGTTMGRAYLKTIESLKMVELEKFVKDHVTQGARVITDYYPSYSSLENSYDHIPISNFTTGKKTDVLPKTHIVVANLKMWLRGTYNCLPAKHLQSYLDEFVFRFNRRWNIENIFNKLLVHCVYTNPITYAELTG
jgi:transposase-like protein